MSNNGRVISMVERVSHVAARQSKQLFFTGMFRPITKGRRPKGVMFVNEISPELTVTVKSWEAMDSIDQDVFLTLLAMARTLVTSDQIDCLIGGMRDGELVEIKEEHREISEKMKLDVDGLKATAKSTVSVVNLPILRIEATVAEIAHNAFAAEKPTGAHYRIIKKALERLSTTAIKYDLKTGSKTATGTVSLLDSYIDSDGIVKVTLNPITAHSIWSPHASYVRTDLAERAMLNTQLSRLLHDYLSGRVNKGAKSRSLSMDGVIDGIYGVTSKESAATRRARRSKVAEACDVISRSLESWNITLDGKGRKQMIFVSR